MSAVQFVVCLYQGLIHLPRAIALRHADRRA